MGHDYSVSHAACLASQLPHGSRCLVAEDPHEEWDDSTRMLWHMERNISLMRWSFARYDGEPQPTPLPYPGEDVDRMRSETRRAESRKIVDRELGMGE